KDGILSGWEPNAEGGRDAMSAAVTLIMPTALDEEGSIFVAAAMEDGRLRKVTRLAAGPQPQVGVPEDRFIRQGRGLDLKTGEGASTSEGAGGTGGAGSGSAATVVGAIRLPAHVESDRTGFATDPARGILYVWGPRIGLRAMPG